MTKNKSVILSVLAHPDDESFGMGGTLALYAQQGHDVYLVCATRGEAGMMDAEYMQGYASIAEKREAELRCAAEKLGLKDVFFLDYRDSGMPGSQDNLHPDAQINAPVVEVAAKVVRYIRELKPDVVLTFDPIGGYHHPDHIHIQQATVLAFEKADDVSFAPESGAPFKPQHLYFHIFPRWFLRIMVSVLPIFGKNPRKWGRNGDIDLKAIAEVRYPTHAKIDITPVMAIKAAAGACHASQGGVGMRRGLMGLVTRIFGEREAYMQAYPPLHGRSKVKRDLLL
ncbi:MAG: PIG-L family deacetylase [Anaerolineales bacterium]|nr:PIG-L family deacetylase [Anaerolineales bacterium]